MSLWKGGMWTQTGAQGERPGKWRAGCVHTGRSEDAPRIQRERLARILWLGPQEACAVCGASISNFQPPDWERTRAGIAVSGLWSCYSSLSRCLRPRCDACCRGCGAGVHCGFVAVIPWFPRSTAGHLPTQNPVASCVQCIVAGADQHKTGSSALPVGTLCLCPRG